MFAAQDIVKVPTMMQLRLGDAVAGELEGTYKLHIALRSKGIQSHGLSFLKE